jgi:hypothetical protein
MLKKLTFTIFAVLLLAGGVFAQGDKDAGPQKSTTDKAATPAATPAAAAAKVSITAQSTPMELARIAQTAHGGDKFKNVQSILLRGTADASAPGSTQTMSSSFYIVTAGDKSRFELNNPLAPFTQVFDGQSLYNSLPQIQIPPMSRLSIALLQKIDDKTYTISALPDKKKKRGFRVTTPDGYATDFYLDGVTGLIDTTEAKFTVDGREISTAISNDKFRAVDGLMIPEKFSQRLDFSGVSFYASFKAKDILVNSELPENTFIIPQ